VLDKTKTDPELGKKVHEFLKEKGVETPLVFNGKDSKEQIEDIEHHMKAVMAILGLDLKDDSLANTPKRVAKMWVNEVMWGLHTGNFPRVMAVENKFNYDEFVVEKGIKVVSLCEHHFVTIYGKAVVAYKPNGKVIGLSKLNRIVEYFSRRPQVQERLTEQVYHTLSYILDTEDIAVIIEADHFCVKTRGVEDTNSTTTTSRVGGVFREKSTARQELFSLIRGDK